MKTGTALAEGGTDWTTFRKQAGPGILLAEVVGHPEVAVPEWRKISSEQILRECLLAPGLIGPERDLVGPRSTVLEAATGNTGSLGHSNWLCLKHCNRTAPECKPVSVEH